MCMQKKVIETKSVEYMPFYLSFFSFLASSLWLAYGLLSHDLFLAVRFSSYHSLSLVCFLNLTKLNWPLEHKERFFDGYKDTKRVHYKLMFV